MIADADTENTDRITCQYLELAITEQKKIKISPNF